MMPPSQSKAVEARRMQIQSSQSWRHQEIAALWTERVASQSQSQKAADQPPSADSDHPAEQQQQLRRAWIGIVSTLSAFAIMSETLRYVGESRRRSSLQ